MAWKPLSSSVTDAVLYRALGLAAQYAIIRLKWARAVCCVPLTFFHCCFMEARHVLCLCCVSLDALQLVSFTSLCAASQTFSPRITFPQISLETSWGSAVGTINKLIKQPSRTCVCLWHQQFPILGLRDQMRVRGDISTAVAEQLVLMLNDTCLFIIILQHDMSFNFPELRWCLSIHPLLSGLRKFTQLIHNLNHLSTHFSVPLFRQHRPVGGRLLY